MQSYKYRQMVVTRDFLGNRFESRLEKIGIASLISEAYGRGYLLTALKECLAIVPIGQKL